MLFFGSQIRKIKLLARIAWQPNFVEVFVGALRYPHYHWFDRVIIHFIMKITQGETNTCREYEYTDWPKVAQFAEKMCKVA
ncbi:flavodoxin domain-containing protein [Rodentibacter caecimuris]|uniref:flavodoxin domain-containing protein n=1 Tax=Rodentibacter caecimuris TaxID=1796644 RepID=UPI0009844298|nr:hypothetical protein BKG97_10570 [Rodentibacter heylii]